MTTASINPVVVLGVFDGVHRGHQALLQHARNLANKAHTTLVAVTFDPHPLAVVRPDLAPAILTDIDQRVAFLREYGADDVAVISFTGPLSQSSPQEFVDLLREQLSPQAIVVGPNFHFGRNAAGNVETLTTLAASNDIRVDVVTMNGDEVPWSSTRVRLAIAEGDVELAATILGRPYCLQAPVVHGDARGREIGFPTANLAVAEGSAIPAEGVYAGWLRSAETAYPAAISVGTNPQFNGQQLRVEAHAIDVTGIDLYDQVVQLCFIARIRGQATFENVNELIRQIGQDVDQARLILSSSVQ